MAKSVLAALDEHACGRDLICLSSILSFLNTTFVLKDLPQSMKSPEGDFMTLLTIMNELLLVKQSASLDESEVSRFCQEKGLNRIEHIIRQALQRYITLEKAFNLSNEYRQKAQIQSDDWRRIACSLLAGYSDNVFVSRKELHERTHQYIRYKDTLENEDDEENQRYDVAVLDLQSTLTRRMSQASVSIVLARDIRCSTAIRSKAILSFVGQLQPSWMKYILKRTVKISFAEENLLRKNHFFYDRSIGYENQTC